MFYKHWKKLALSLTGFFWASCSSDVTAPTSGDVNSSSSSNDQNQSSSSSDNPSSSSQITPESSSDFEYAMPAYGVYQQVVCYEDGKGVKTNGEIAQTKLLCENGVTCKETVVLKTFDPPCSPLDESDLEGAVVCPDYGIIHLTEKTYTCDDGNTYNEAEFKALYNKLTVVSSSSNNAIQSSSSSENTEYKETSVLYGPPCVFNNTCNDE